MARGLGWSPEAIEDIEAIASYIERDSPWYTKAVASKIVETAETIPEHRTAISSSRRATRLYPAGILKDLFAVVIDWSGFPANSVIFTDNTDHPHRLRRHPSLGRRGE